MNAKTHTNNSKVCIQKDSYEKIDIDSLIEPLGGIQKFVNNGEKVLLKTNLLNATYPKKAVVTHPKLIGQVAKSVQKAD